MFGLVSRELIVKELIVNLSYMFIELGLVVWVISL